MARHTGSVKRKTVATFQLLELQTGGTFDVICVCNASCTKIASNFLLFFIHKVLVEREGKRNETKYIVTTAEHFEPGRNKSGNANVSSRICFGFSFRYFLALVFAFL